MSLPAWGAWIEILNFLATPRYFGSLPAWGAWIEIEMGKAIDRWCWSLPAWGAWIEMQMVCGWWRVNRVAPRMGSVD